MVLSSDELAQAVNKRGQVVIDMKALKEHVGGMLDKRLASSIDERVSAIETKVSELGAKQIEKAAEKTQVLLNDIEQFSDALERSERRLERLSAKVTWVAAGRLAMALLPFAVVLLVFGGLTMAGFHALGLGSLLGWAWDSFTVAEFWWQKTLISVGSISGVAAFVWLVWKLTRRLSDEYSRW